MRTLLILVVLVGFVAERAWSQCRRDWVICRSHPVSWTRHDLAFDSSRGVAVLFGGGTQNIAIGSAWIWDADHWKRASLHLPIPPSPVHHRLAYDEGRQRVVWIGPDTFLHRMEVWEFDGREWRRRSTGGPPEQYGFGVAYDPSQGGVVLFCGRRFGGGGEIRQTWLWDGADWTLIDGASPSADYPGLAFDRARGVLVLYDDNSDTYEFTGDQWLRRTADGPCAPHLASFGIPSFDLTYDDARGVVSLVADCSLAPGFQFGVWDWDGLVWRAAPASAEPNPDRVGQATYDSIHNTLLWVGPNEDNTRSRTWLWDGQQWGVVPIEPTERAWARMVYDSARAECVLFGGQNDAVRFDETLIWDGATWTARDVAGPAPLSEHAMAFDSTRNVTVLFGGATGETTLSRETWEWDGGAWSLRATDGPSARRGAAMCFDSARNVTVLFGGHDGADDGETWEWDGAAWTLRVTDGPPPRRYAAAAFDVERGVTTLSGGGVGGTELHHAGVRLGDTWLWDGVEWTLTAASPYYGFGHQLVYDAARRQILSSGGTFAWDGAQWRQLPATSTFTSYGVACAYDSARDVVVAFGGHSVAGHAINDTYELTETWSLADLDLDDDVDIEDLTVVLTNFGYVGELHEPGDIDRDCDVDILDLATALSDFGKHCPE